MIGRCLKLGAVAAMAVTITSCAQSSGPGLPGPSAAQGVGYSAVPFGCYVTKIDPAPVQATITFYGWPDNDPPGNGIAHPVIHSGASGSGTYCDPTTFATERKNNDRIPYGIKLYVPAIRQYFIREDDCAASGPRKGHGNNGCHGLWFDLWIGGDAASHDHAVIKCEYRLTPNAKVRVILNPKDGMPVKFPGPIYNDAPPPNGTCLGQPE